MAPRRSPPADPAPETLFSQEALHRAWRLVRRSGEAPGTDGINRAAFERNLDRELRRLADDLITGRYQPQPVRRYTIAKPSGGRRALTIWAIRDRVAQRVAHDYLTPLLENVFLNCSYGFRPGRSVPESVRAVLRARDRNRRWVLDADIRDCFDSISPDLLRPQLFAVVPSRAVTRLILQWLETPVEKQPGRLAGVAQGSVISPLLANLYLHRFDQMLLAALPGVTLVRFADDFVVLSRRRQEAVWAMEVARRSLANLRLVLNEEKTRVVHFNDGFTFLGADFRGSWHSAAPGG